MDKLYSLLYLYCRGYKLVYHAYLSQFPQDVVLSNTTFAYTITGLEYDTWYVISVLPYTTVGDGPRTSYPEKTLGPTTKAPEEVTKYYCYEAIPGTLVFSWESMPCTIYVGVIGALFLFLLMALVACCCKGSKKTKETHSSNVQMMPPVIHLKEKVKVIQAMNRFKKNRKGGENGTNDNRDMDYNGNSFGRGISNNFTNNFGDDNPRVRPRRGGNDDDGGEDDAQEKRTGLWGIGLNNLLGKGREGSKDKLVDDRQDPYGDPESSRWNGGRGRQRGDPFDKKAGKNAATASALRARGKKNTVSPLNFDDEGYYDDDGDEYGDDSGDLTARDIRLFSKQPGKNSNPDIARRGSKKGNATVPVLDKRFNRDISGVDLYLEDNDDNYDGENFEHPPPAPRFHLGDDASVDLPFGGDEVGAKDGIPLGADGDDAAFF